MNSLDSKTFTIFHPVKKFYFTTDTLTFILMMLSILPVIFELVILKRSGFSVLSALFFSAYFIIVLVSIVLQFMAKRRYEVLKGILGGEITFHPDRITINGDDFLLTDMRKLNIYTQDYLDMVAPSGRTANGRKLYGTNNRAELYLNKGKTLICYFQRIDDNTAKVMADLYTGYYTSGKLHWLTLLDLLGISKYEEIQRFKSKVATGVVTS